ncbi:MAG: M23 family metallopeptidase [Anaerolineae bacterium]|nr:M23 family metallopeptidase [Anaerolineae bacterium]
MSKKAKTQEAPEVETQKVETTKVSRPPLDWGTVLSWGITGLIVAGLVLVLLKINPFKSDTEIVENADPVHSLNIPLPGLASGLPVNNLIRVANINTSVPEGVRQFAVKYTVVPGDSLFTIAKVYGVTAESILWANYEMLDDDPTFLKEGWVLTIPPTNGIYYKWKEGDTIEKIAEKYYADPDEIITWPGNNLDIANLNTEYLTGVNVMIPGGYRELVSWIVPVDFAPRSGATKTIAGPGGCITPETGPIGGFLQWPVGSRYLTGFDFTSYHLGIDLAAAEGTPVFASAAGTVVYAGWNDSGYGNLVAIDHNNGYKTIYAHLSQLYVSCGQDVSSGQGIALSGNTGKSTGGHLHYEIRRDGQYLNPWQVLP